MLLLEDFTEEYDALTRDVMGASHQTYELKLSDFFVYLDGADISKARIAELDGAINFDEWYETQKKTIRSMVGSGRLAWASNPSDRLPQYLGLFRKMASTNDFFSDFCMAFLYTDNNYDVMVGSINQQYFEPFARSLLKDLIAAAARTNAAPSATDVPASDRIVTLDHNSTDHKNALAALDSIQKTMVESNEIGANAPPLQKDRVLKEIQAGRTLLEALEARASAVWAVLYPALRWVADHAGGSVISVVVVGAIALLASLLGITIPGVG